MPEERSDEEAIDVADGDGFGGEGNDLRLRPVAVCVGGRSFLEVAEAFDGASGGEI